MLSIYVERLLSQAKIPSMWVTLLVYESYVDCCHEAVAYGFCKPYWPLPSLRRLDRETRLLWEEQYHLLHVPVTRASNWNNDLSLSNRQYLIIMNYCVCRRVYNTDGAFVLVNLNGLSDVKIQQLQNVPVLWLRSWSPPLTPLPKIRTLCELLSW